jgi:AraC family transcriptional activator of tynA and feaB
MSLARTATMCSRNEFLNTPIMNYEQWQDAVRSICGQYSPCAIEPTAFSGRLHARSVYGLRAVDISGSAHRFERTRRDVRLDAKDHYFAFFQITGQSKLVQNDQILDLSAGDITLVDAARPITYFSEENGNCWGSVQLPRRSLVSYLGFEPRCASRPNGPAVARQIRQLLQDSAEDEQSMSATAKDFMRLALFDLVGALFVPANPRDGTLGSDRLFMRICDIIRDRYADPDFGPADVAVEARLSLRYVQKLFTARNSTCTRFINSVRLERAAFLIKRRLLLKTGQPIREIAYACGFGDYAYFSRMFRRHFGHSPAIYLRHSE